MDDPGADARGGPDAAQARPFAVDGRVDHPLVVGEVAEVDDVAGGRGVGVGQGDELRFAGDDFMCRQAVGDP